MHSKLYVQIMNSREWRELRNRKMEANPLCERCQEQGYVRSARCVHHIVPVESGRTDDECRALAYRWTNLQSLCYECHKEIHHRMGKDTKENHQQRERDKVQAWMERHTKKK